MMWQRSELLPTFALDEAFLWYRQVSPHTVYGDCQRIDPGPADYSA